MIETAQSKHDIYYHRAGAGAQFFFGLVGFGVALAFSLVNAFLMRDGVFPATVPSLFWLLLALLSVVLLTRGKRHLGLQRLARELKQALKNRDSIPLTELAEQRGQSLEKLSAGLISLQRLGGLPKGSLDLLGQQLVLDGKPAQAAVDDAFCLVKEERKSTAPYYFVILCWWVYVCNFPLLRVSDIMQGLILSVLVFVLALKLYPPTAYLRREALPPPAPIHTGNLELDAFLQQGVEAMQQFNALLRGIQKEEVREELTQIQRTAKEIFDFVQENPGKINHLRQFSHYYLPLTLKLLGNYQELEKQTVKGENVAKSLRKIEEMMATVGQAYRKELDSLYQDKALDISAEIAVMKSMMELDGVGNALRLDHQERNEGGANHGK